jgi:hypothetical protein
MSFFEKERRSSAIAEKSLLFSSKKCFQRAENRRIFCRLPAARRKLCFRHLLAFFINLKEDNFSNSSQIRQDCFLFLSFFSKKKKTVFRKAKDN